MFYAFAVLVMTLVPYVGFIWLAHSLDVFLPLLLVLQAIVFIGSAKLAVYVAEKFSKRYEEIVEDFQ